MCSSRFFILLLSLLAFSSLYAMERDPKKQKIAHGQVILISKDQATLTVDEKEAKLSEYIKEGLKKSSIILLPVDQEVLSVVVNVLKALKKIHDNGITSANPDEYNKALSIHLLPLLKKMPFEKVAKIVNASYLIGIAPLSFFIKSTIVKLIHETTDITKLQQFMEKLTLLDLKVEESIKNDFLINEAKKVVGQSCQEAKATAALIEHLEKMNMPQLTLLIKLNQLNPLRTIGLPYYKHIVESFGELKELFDSYFDAVILKNRISVKVESVPAMLKKIQRQRVNALTGNVILESSDGQKFNVACSAAQQSNTLNSLIEDVVGEQLQSIPLANINGKALALIVESLQKISDIAAVPNYGQAVAQALDPLFVGLLNTDVIELLRGANYLEVKALLDYMIALCIAQLQHSTDIDSLACFIQALINEEIIPKELQNLLLDSLKENNQGMLDALMAKPIKIITLEEEIPVISIVVGPDDKYALIGSHSATYLCDLATGKTIKKLYELDNPREIAFSPDGKKALTSSSYRSTRPHFFLWDLTQDGYELRPYMIFMGFEGSWGGASIRFSSDGKSALWISGDSIRTLDLALGKVSNIIRLCPKDEGLLATSYDGKYCLAFNSLSSRETIGLWNCHTGELLKELTLPCYARKYALSADGKKFLVDTPKSQLIVELRDLETGATIKALEGHTNDVQTMTFSSDDRYALTAGKDTTARLWDLKSGKTVQVLKGHTNWIRSIALSSDCKQALTGCTKGKVCLWNLVSVMDGLSLAQLIAVRLGQQVDKNKLMNHSYFGSVCKSLPPGLI